MRMPEPKIRDLAGDVYNDTYRENMQLNRADRRTAKGRQLVAEARVKALEAKIAVLENAPTEIS